jgi:hypothetical protein
VFAGTYQSPDELFGVLGGERQAIAQALGR